MAYKSVFIPKIKAIATQITCSLNFEENLNYFQRLEIESGRRKCSAHAHKFQFISLKDMLFSSSTGSHRRI